MLLRLQKQSVLRMVMGAAIAFFLFTLILTLHRHYTFYSSYDQGIFNQVFWNNLHGRFFQSTLSSQLSTNVVHNSEVPEVFYHRLGQHFTPALLLWLPLYALFPYPATLTVLQVTLVTAAGLVLYVLARQYLEPPLSAMITVSFYCANAVLGPTLSNFHDICQIPLFMFSLLLAMEKRWWWLFWVLAVLILAVREDSGVSLFGVGFYMILSKRYPRIGLAVCTLSFGYMIVLTNLIMPLFSEDISQRFMMERFGQYADGDEASTLEIIWGMVSNPMRLIVELFSPLDRTIKYLLGQWLPLAFVPAIAPASWMIAGFPLLKLLLGKGMSVLAISIRYAMTVVPGLFYGTILWWGRKQNRGAEGMSNSQSPIPKSFRRFWIICLSLSLFFTFTSNPNRTLYFLIPDSIQPLVYVPLPRQWEHVSQVRPLLAQIPPGASVTASTYLIPHLSGRREIIRFPNLQLRNDAREVVNVDYIIADLWQMQQYQTAFREERELLQNGIPFIDQLSSSGQYGIIGFKDGVILMQKGAASVEQAIASWQAFRQQVPPK
ncbi:DUF2079 domain-containing protein [Funiculus sociatus GB2-A5]|uniref:DUF2079 domain-containing protein n=1 Tax=Funiculus sociatus GB2-A5 TaxID=2933946 RepID=A0ABV0JQQ2_9CYAN|nr:MULTISPECIES: DUF2079 domain-containing protein [unclassified Trichocoleus]MBD1904276.1 DUF2079 domain-containing protein [Trichocoleus sp. FACHB-832]MBD2064181.1 DUF2079 domain-containing protein [Trichocoleus sp. FACHB-6]